MPVFSYKTIQSPSEGQFRDRGSRFMAFAFPVEDEAQVKELLSALQKKYFDARHQGYAYMIGPERQRWRAFDDGEPTHSTGDPILGQIRSRGLTNVLVAVVRYFGGTKLGVSGLITAYRSAAADALDHATVVEREVMTSLELEFDFVSTPEVMRLIKDYSLVIRRQEYQEKTLLTLDVPLRAHERLLERIGHMQATGSTIVMRF